MAALRIAIRARLDQAQEIRDFDETHGSIVRGASRQILNLVNEPMFRSSFPMMARVLLGDPVLGERDPRCPSQRFRDGAGAGR